MLLIQKVNGSHGHFRRNLNFYVITETYFEQVKDFPPVHPRLCRGTLLKVHGITYGYYRKTKELL